MIPNGIDGLVAVPRRRRRRRRDFAGIDAWHARRQVLADVCSPKNVEARPALGCDRPGPTPPRRGAR